VLADPHRHGQDASCSGDRGGLAEVYQDGTHVVELASLSEPELVPREVASALGVVELPDRPLVDTLADSLLEKELLLVLDNCEHLLDACAHLAAALVVACPEVRIFATSRQPLRVAGEAVYSVPPLSVPASGADVEGLGRHAAVMLFVERARLRLPAFEVTPENASVVAEVCRKLESIPLAIELAAARMDVLTAEQIAKRLDRALGLLTGGREAGHRHRTLRATLDWSHELLSKPERGLFAKLSVFAGGWTLEAAEAVGAGDGVGEGDVLELFLGLVDKSLILAEPDRDSGFRYGMLEPVRQYARERLQEGGEAEATRHQHALWLLKFAEEAEEGWSGPEHAAWVRRLETEHDNLRAALRWAIDFGEAGLSLRLAGALAVLVRGRPLSGEQRVA
jgi:predicted ATPase